MNGTVISMGQSVFVMGAHIEPELICKNSVIGSFNLIETGQNFRQIIDWLL